MKLNEIADFGDRNKFVDECVINRFMDVDTLFQKGFRIIVTIKRVADLDCTTALTGVEERAYKAGK